MFRIDTTVVGFLAAAVMMGAGGLWIVFDSPSHPLLQQMIGGQGSQAPSSGPIPTREQISAMREDVEAAREGLRRAERQGGRAAMQDALKRYDQAQRRYTDARLQSLESTASEFETE
jgi:hypothetical protein